MNKKIVITLTAFIFILIFSRKFAASYKTQQNQESAALTTPTNSPSTPSSAGSDKPTNESILGEKQYSTPPEMFLDPEKAYQVILETNFGNILIELFHHEVPIAANNFAFLVKDGFYDSLIFHRVVKDFMIQGGDPKSDGTGGPGYSFEDELISRDYERGIVAYANSGPNTNGSQFFIMHQNYSLPPNYVIFGQVVEGMKTVDKIAEMKVTNNRFGEISKPKEQIFINKASLLEL